MARILEVGDAPSSLDEFGKYVNERVAELTVTDQARQIAHHVLHPELGGIPKWSYGPLRVVTTDLLPQRLRDGYGLRLSPRQGRWLRRFQSASRATLPRMPGWVRTFPLLRPISGLRERVSA